MPILVVIVAVLSGLLMSEPAATQESSRDKDSVELVARGCLKGRELTAEEVSGGDDLDLTGGLIFRLSAKGDVERDVKRQNGHLVEVTGLVKKTALATPGFKIGGGRIVIGSGGPMSTDPTRNPARNPSRRLVPMSATNVVMVAETCPAIRGQ